MAEAFDAVVIEKADRKITAAHKKICLEDLPPEDVTISVAYSTLNYKDGLALTGTAPIARTYPMIGGIDLAGTVESSESPDYRSGDRVLVNGWGLSMTHGGGYAQKQRVKPEWLTRVPDAFSLSQAMAIGTAGYTAMLCVLELERMGVQPGDREVIVTGAGGGVGSVAIAVLAKLGFRVVASTGRPQLAAYLTGLGASSIIDRAELREASGRPLDAERWAGAVDSVGGQTLASVLSGTCYGGTVTACGLAGGADLPTSVLPFILRNVNLIGVDSVVCPGPTRQLAWDRLSEDLAHEPLESMTVVEPMSRILELAPQILAGQIRGRVVIDVNA